jgi:hypothetical protein
MESIFSSEITIPLFEVILLLVLSTLAFLFGRLKLAILINYCFTVYWGYVLNFNIFTAYGALLPNTFTYIYLGGGFLIILLAILGFWTQHD